MHKIQLKIASPGGGMLKALFDCLVTPALSEVLIIFLIRIIKFLHMIVELNVFIN